MPSHTIPSALIKMFYAQEGAPWTFPVFQDLTGVHHGLFPTDDAWLPHQWTRSMANNIQSYFQQYNNQRTEDEKMKFASTNKKKGLDTVPGRPLWREWVTSHYSLWKIHSLVSTILSESGLHPIQIMVANNDLESFPSSTMYLPMAIDPVARALFGEEALDSNGRLVMPLREPCIVLLQRLWENLKKQTTRNKNRVEKLEAAAEKAFETLSREKLTKRNINSVIRAVSQWKHLAEIFGTKDVLEKIKGMDVELKLLLEGLGVKVAVGRTSRTKALCKVTKNDLSNLAKEEDISDILDCYEAFFSIEDDLPLPSGDFIGIKFGEKSNGSDPDPGVEEEAKLTLGEVLKNLGFGDKALPFNFNRYRHVAGLTPWDPEHSSLFSVSEGAQPKPGIEKFLLRNHQIAGMHAVIRKVFSKTPDPKHCGGMLIADEVGVGKTFEACTVIAFLCELGIKQARGLAIPPIIKAHPYLGDKDTIPSLPHLIVVPGTLLSQWEHELKVVFQPKYVDILLYGQGLEQHERFWSDQGPYKQAKHPPYGRIILASHSALLQDYGTLYLSEKNPKDLPWVQPARSPAYAQNIHKTLYCQSYLSVAFDEAQVDIAAMGRLVGIPYFSSKEAFDDQQQDAAELRRAKIEKARMTKGNSEENSGNEGAPAADSDPVKLKQVESSARMNQQFDGRLLRRTADSVGIDGKPLVQLPGCTVIHGVVKLSKREMDIIESVTEINLDSASTANGINITTKKFYLEHRINVSYASEDPADKIPYFKTLEEWEPVKSTKIDTCCRMVRHLLSRDDAPKIIFENGAAQFPPLPPLQPGNVPTREAKIVIYQEFSSFSKLVINILELYGVVALAINGRTSYEQRFEVLNKFMTDPSTRVLIVSQIGSVGLNMTSARYLIFLDQLWSHQEEHQIKGRIYRQGQKHHVVCYHIIAENTADVVLARLAHGKLQMLEAFLSTDKAKELLSVLSGGMVEETEDQEKEPKKKKAKAKSKGKSKETAVEEVKNTSSEMATEKAKPPGGSAPKDKRTARGKKTDESGNDEEREVADTLSGKTVYSETDPDASIGATTPYMSSSAASSMMDISTGTLSGYQSEEIESPDSPQANYPSPEDGSPPEPPKLFDGYGSEQDVPQMEGDFEATGEISPEEFAQAAAEKDLEKRERDKRKRLRSLSLEEQSQASAPVVKESEHENIGDGMLIQDPEIMAYVKKMMAMKERTKKKARINADVQPPMEPRIRSSSSVGPSFPKSSDQFPISRKKSKTSEPTAPNAGVRAGPSSGPSSSSQPTKGAKLAREENPKTGPFTNRVKPVIPVHRQPSSFGNPNSAALPPQKPPKAVNPFLKRRGE